MRQLSLFEQENKAIAYIAGFTSLVKASMNSAAAASPYSRQQILERMNMLTARAGKRLTSGKAKSISIDTLEKWLNPESDAVPTLLALEVFMQAANTVEPLKSWLQLHNCALMTPQDEMLRDLGKTKLAQKRHAERARELENKLQGVVK